MPSKLLMDQYDVPLDIYMDNLEQFSGSLPTIEEIKDAILAFCPFDPRTNDMLVKKSISSLHVLDRILYLPHYPESFGLINNPFFVAMCLIKIEEHLQRHQLFDLASGILLLKVLSLGNMIAILAQKGQLDTLIRLTSQWKWANEGRFDATMVLLVRASNALQEEMNTDRGFAGLTFWGRHSSMKIDGQSKQEGYFTPERSQLLLSRLWEQRDIMLSTFSQSPAPGLATVLLVVSANALKYPQISLSDTRQSTNRSKDLLARYSLVAAQGECAVVQGQCPSKEHFHLAPVSPTDHCEMANLLAQRLLPIDQHPRLFFARHSGFMIFQFMAAAKTKNAFELCTPVMQASFDFFWWELLLPEKDASPWSDITTFGPGAVVMLEELVSAAKVSRNLQPLIPAALKALNDVDFIDWCGRLALMPIRR